MKRRPIPERDDTYEYLLARLDERFDRATLIVALNEDPNDPDCLERYRDGLQRHKRVMARMSYLWSLVLDVDKHTSDRAAAIAWIMQWDSAELRGWSPAWWLVREGKEGYPHLLTVAREHFTANTADIASSS